jgi:2-polyprenyl-6-methoxyphenol hydroxylase-like FAD-dependent oxidoreductase
MAVTHTETEKTTLQVHFANGESFDADLLVGADGLRSTVRGQIVQRATPKCAVYIAWRGLVDESQISNNTHAIFFDRLTFFLPPNEQMVGYPVAGLNDEVTPGNKRYNFVWYRPADATEDLPRMLTMIWETITRWEFHLNWLVNLSFQKCGATQRDFLHLNF